MPVSVRLVMAAIGVIAIGVGIIRVRAAVDSAEEAARCGATPRPLRSVFMYRIAGLMTAVVGAAFVAIAILAP